MSRIWPRWLPLAAFGICLLLSAFIPVTIPIEDDVGTPQPVSATGTDADAARPVGGIVAGTSVIQQFPAAGTHIRSISLLLATYKRNNHGSTEAIVQAYANGKWQDLATRTIKKDTLKDNAYDTLAFTPQLPVVRGQLIRITLRSDGGPNDAITWWTNPTWQPDGYALTYGGRPQQGTASFRVGYAASSRPLIASLPLLWHRLTIFLNPLWQAALLVNLSLVVVGAGAIGVARTRWWRERYPGEV